MRILVAEDDDPTAVLVERGLAGRGHGVARVADGPRALHACLAEQFDVLILDRMLPELDGVQVLRRLGPQA